MDKKKGFWSSLFGRENAEKEETESLPSILKNEYGIEITQAETSLSEIHALGYRRMDATEIGHFNGVLQYVPQILASNAYSQSVGQAFNAAVQGTFRVKLRPGMHLAASKATLGAYRATGLSNATNQVAGQAELIKNNASLSVSNAPQIALGVFNALSMVTGQYFMSQINGKMALLKEGVDRIENFLDAAQRSKLKAACQEMEDIINRSEFILGDPSQLQTTVDQIHAIQRTAQESIFFCQEQIKTVQNTLKKEDKDEVITEKLITIGKYLAQYHMSVQLYSVATLLEVQVRELDDAAEIKAYRNQMNERIITYKTDFTECSANISRYLDENHALNDRSIWQNIASIATAGAAAAVGGLFALFPGIKLAHKVDDLFVDQQKKLKAERVEMAGDLIDPLADASRLEAPVQILNSMEQVRTHDVEILQIGSDYYTNLPENVITA